MKYVTIDPKTRKIETVEAESLHDAERTIGLDPGQTDHGSLGRDSGGGIGYVVFEYGLYVPSAEQSYFGIAGRLIAGAAVLYGFDEAGESVDLMKSTIPDVRFYLGINDVEAAIERGEIARPALTINGSAIWEWPAPAPPGMMG